MLFRVIEIVGENATKFIYFIAHGYMIIILRENFNFETSIFETRTESLKRPLSLSLVSNISRLRINNSSFSRSLLIPLEIN